MLQVFRFFTVYFGHQKYTGKYIGLLLITAFLNRTILKLVLSRIACMRRAYLRIIINNQKYNDFHIYCCSVSAELSINSMT